jgi:glycosyltransferase involved in cell wall biosynthesis
MAIHQVVVSAVPGDAITGAALEYRRLLRRVGPSEIYAAHRDRSLLREVHSLRDYPAGRRADPGNLLIAHVSIGDVAVSRFLAEYTGRTVVMYHNITPAEYFRPFDRRFARLLQQGRVHLGDLRDRTTLALADSEYNAQELRDAGYSDVRVVPLVVDGYRLQRVSPDPATERWIADRPGPVILFVGQVLPHKRHDLLLEAFHVLSSELVPEATLVLAGPLRLPAYEQTLRQLRRELGLANVRFTGSISPEKLVAYFRGATVFASASDHEGLCLPVLEAMAFDVPVVARGVAALPETIGDAGLVLPADPDPVLLAEAMAMVIESHEARELLVERGRARVATHFDPDRARSLFLEALLEVA